MQATHGNYPKENLFTFLKTVKFVLIPLLLLKLFAVEHHPTENATLLNTVIISLIPNSTILDL